MVFIYSLLCKLCRLRDCGSSIEEFQKVGRVFCNLAKYFQSYTLYFILGRFVADINSAAEDPTQKVLELTISGVK